MRVKCFQVLLQVWQFAAIKISQASRFCLLVKCLIGQLLWLSFMQRRFRWEWMWSCNSAAYCVTETRKTHRPSRTIRRYFSPQKCEKQEHEFIKWSSMKAKQHNKAIIKKKQLFRISCESYKAWKQRHSWRFLRIKHKLLNIGPKNKRRTLQMKWIKDFESLYLF